MGCGKDCDCDGDNTKKSNKAPAPAPAIGGSGGTVKGSAPGGNPRFAPLDDGKNRVPDDAKGYNPGSIVSGG